MSDTKVAAEQVLDNVLTNRKNGLARIDVLKKQLETVPAEIKAEIASIEQTISHLDVIAGAMHLVKSSEQLMGEVETRAKGLIAEVEAGVKKAAEGTLKLVETKLTPANDAPAGK